MPEPAFKIIPLKPISQFIAHWDQLISDLKNYKGRDSLKLAVVGAGASGLEISIILQMLIDQQKWNAQVNLIHRHDFLVSAIDLRAQKKPMLAGISPNMMRELKARASDLDLIGVEMYADIVNLPRYLKESNWTGPYVVTEWGATGHWEVGKTDWGAPIENDSTTKANFYLKRYEAVIRPDQKQCLGSYVFLWGQKQVRTPTWYGLFLESGEETAAVDVMHYLWNGVHPANRTPRLEGVWLEGKTARQNIRLKPGQACRAKVEVRDILAVATVPVRKVREQRAVPELDRGIDPDGLAPELLDGLGRGRV